MQADRSSRAPVRPRRRLIVSAVTLLLASIIGFTSPASAQSQPDPILFIHGFSGNASFLNALNSGDETPGSVSYGTFWSYCDGIIIPAESTVLSDATNTNVGCVDHLSLLTNTSVFAGVRDFVR